MARIFTAMYNMGRDPMDFNKMPPFLEGFIMGLKNAGNEVLCFQHKTYGREFNGELPEEYRNRITDFNPELCIFFCNNFWDISDIVDCPIVIYDIDSILEYRGIDKLQQNIDRYLFVVNQTAAIDVVMEHLGTSERQICHIPFFSEINAREVKSPLRDITFLGANWSWKGYDFVKAFMSKNPNVHDKMIAKQLLNQYIENPFSGIGGVLNGTNLHPQIPLTIANDKRAAIEISGVRRLRYLSSVADLDLEVRGNYWNIDCLKFFPEVFLCVNNKRTFSLAENEEFYNSAKLSLNTKHIQAQNGFSFRVCDIMASNACLVTEECSDLSLLFPKVPIPTFNSPAELREQCLKLLNDESLRKEIVLASNEAIDNGHRFRHVLASLEEFVGKELRSSEEGDVVFFSDENPETPFETAKVEEQQVIRFKDKVLNHLGYGTVYNNVQNNVKIGPISILRIVKSSNNVTDVYLFFLPLLRQRKTGGERVIYILLIEKMRTFFSLLKGKLSRKIKTQYLTIKKKIHRRNLKKKWNKGEKIKIVLFVSRISCWLFGDLYQLLKESSHFEPIIVIKPFVSQGKEAMIRYHETTYDALVEQGFEPVKGYDIETDEYLDVRKKINPDIVFYTKYWLPHFHPNFYVDKFLDKLSFFTLYGFYVAKDSRSMNFELNNLVDRFFMPTSIQKEIAKVDMDNHGENVYVTGSLKFDKFFDKEYQVKPVWKEQKKVKKKVIWAPHHEDRTPNWMYQFDAFYEMVDFMLEIVDEFKEEVQFAFKPHPMLKEKLYYRWGQDNTDRYYQEWEKRENCQLEEGGFEDLFLGSDAMIMDSISFIAEYTAVDKPALFTIGKQARVYLNDYGEKNREVLYEAEGDLRAGVTDFIKNVVIKGQDYKAEDRAAFVKEYLLPPNGKTAAENVFQSICDEINKN